MSQIQPIVMPKWGLAMQEGMVAEWHVEPGAEIPAGQEIMDIETSKITNVHESPVSGKLRRIVVQPGETVPVGALLGVCASDAVSDAEIDAYVQDFVDSFDWSGASADTGPEPETLEAGPYHLRYLKMGEASGRPVVFIHGFGGDLNNWMFNQEGLSESHTTYALDLPGHGGSIKEVGDGDLAMLADSVAHFLDALSIDMAHLVGHSMGGAVSLLLALERAPGRVASLTLIAPTGIDESINMDYIDGFITQTRAKKLRGVMELLVNDPSAITGDMVEDVIRYKRVDGTRQALDSLRGGLFPDGKQAQVLTGRLGELSVPIQVIWGSNDRILPASQADKLPSGIFVHRIEHAGHMAHMEHAQDVNALITRLVAG